MSGISNRLADITSRIEFYKDDIFNSNREAATLKRKEAQVKRSKYFEEYKKTGRHRESMFKADMKRRSYKQKIKFSPIERRELLDRDNWTCQNCNTKVHDNSKGNWNTLDKAHIDHIQPISKGGTSTPDNLQVLCRTCNLSKRARVC